MTMTSDTGGHLCAHHYPRTWEKDQVSGKRPEDCAQGQLQCKVRVVSVKVLSCVMSVSRQLDLSRD